MWPWKKPRTQNDISIDIETLGRSPGCVVLSIGAARIWSPSEAFHCSISIDDQLRKRMSIDPATRDWWDKQDPVISGIAHSEEFSVVEALGRLNAFLGDVPIMWASPCSFDIPILEELYRRFERTIPWGYRHVRDLKTLRDILGYGAYAPNRQPHNAMEDAIAQAHDIHACLKLTGWRF